MTVCNLYVALARHPRYLRAMLDPIGPDNDATIAAAAAAAATLTVAAWGTGPSGRRARDARSPPMPRPDGIRPAATPAFRPGGHTPADTSRCEVVCWPGHRAFPHAEGRDGGGDKASPPTTSSPLFPTRWGCRHAPFRFSEHIYRLRGWRRRALCDYSTYPSEPRPRWPHCSTAEDSQRFRLTPSAAASIAARACTDGSTRSEIRP